MKTEDNVLSIKRMHFLKSLGLDISNASACWYLPTDDNYKWVVLPTQQTVINYYECVPTYTLQDMLNMLPNYSLIKSPSLSDTAEYDECEIEVRFDKLHKHPITHGVNEIDAVYNMITYCLLHRLIDTGKSSSIIPVMN